MKTAISIPNTIFESAEQLAANLGVSRSELYSTAVANFIEAHAGKDVTKRLNDVYGSDPEFSTLEKSYEILQFSSLPDDW